MFIKLAFRNVKRGIANYLIYFLTVSLTVAMMFSFCNVIFSDRLVEIASLVSEMKGGLIAVTVMMSLVISFILGYANSFMLRLRKKEFGACMTLGMTRRQVISLFLTENLFLGAISLLSGVFFGLFVYQLLMGIVTRLMETAFVFGDYSKNGLLTTIVIVAIMFLLSSLTSAIYLRRVSIYDLLNNKADTKQEKNRSKAVWFWAAVAVISAAAVVYACILFGDMLDGMFSGNMDDFTSIRNMMCSFLLLTGGIFFLHMGIAKSLTNLMLKSKKICACGTNTFLLRQLGSRLKSNSAICGILAVLLSFAIIGANVSFGQKATNAAALENEHPFDIMITAPAGETEYDGEQDKSLNEDYFIRQMDCIAQYAEVKQSLRYSVYTSGKNDLYSCTPWSGEGYEGLTDCYIKLSDFNRLMSMIGREGLETARDDRTTGEEEPETCRDSSAGTDGITVLTESVPVLQSDFSNAVMNWNEKKYGVSEVTDRYPVLSLGYFVAVVPDEAVVGMSRVTDFYSMMIDYNGLTSDTENTRKSGNLFGYQGNAVQADALNEQMNAIYEASGADRGMSPDYREPQIREYCRNDANSLTTIFVISELFISLLCVMMALAILALKNLTGIAEDSKRYHVLYCLGTTGTKQAATLFKQHAAFFFLPYPFAILLSVPAAMLCIRIMRYNGFEELIGTVIRNSAVIAISFSIIYVLYFIATYLIAKKSLSDVK